MRPLQLQWAVTVPSDGGRAEAWLKGAQERSEFLLRGRRGGSGGGVELAEFGAPAAGFFGAVGVIADGNQLRKQPIPVFARIRSVARRRSNASRHRVARS